MTETEFDSLLKRAASMGFRPNAAQALDIENAKTDARRAFEAEQGRALASLSTFERFARYFNAAYVPLLNGIIRGGDLIVTVAITLIVALFAPISWVMVFLVEVGRVALGLSLFISDSTHASEAAVALIIFNAVVEVSIHFEDRRHNRTPPRELQFSFRLLAKRIAYWIGGRGWQEQEKIDAERRLRTWITFALLLITTLGAIQPIVDAAPGNWRTGAQAVILDVSLADAVSVLGNLILGATLVIGSQMLIRFMVLRSLDTLDGIASLSKAAANSTAAAIAAAEDRAAANELRAMLKAWRSPAPALNAPAPAALPTGNPPPVSVSGVSGNEKQKTGNDDPFSRAVEWFLEKPERQRDNFMKFDEIAAELGVSKATISRARRRARGQGETAQIRPVSGVSGNQKQETGNDEPIPPVDLPSINDVNQTV